MKECDCRHLTISIEAPTARSFQDSGNGLAACTLTFTNPMIKAPAEYQQIKAYYKNGTVQAVPKSIQINGRIVMPDQIISLPYSPHALQLYCPQCKRWAWFELESTQSQFLKLRAYAVEQKKGS